MKLRIHYTTQLKAELGIDTEEIEVPEGSRFSNVLGMLTQRYPDAFGRLVVAVDGRLMPSILPCIDDEQISPDDDPVLEAGSSVTLLSAISGG